MDSFNRVLDLSSSSLVELGASYKDLIHKKLVLGNTKYMCRYGTLSDGHERITSSQRYYQAIKEMWYICNNIKEQKAVAMLAQADYLEGKEKLESAIKDTDKLRAQAAILRAEMLVIRSLTTVEDLLRSVEEYKKIIDELGPSVDAQYPEGIEQAEPDNWEAIARYRMAKERTPGLARERLDNIVLDPIRKAQLGYIYGRFDAIAPLEIANPEACAQVAQDFERRYLEIQEKEKA